MYVCISAAPTRRIFVKFDIGEFYENLLRKSKFVSNWAKMSGIVQEGLINSIVADTLNRHQIPLFH
jgi:hypothetical protein